MPLKYKTFELRVLWSRNNSELIYGDVRCLLSFFSTLSRPDCYWSVASGLGKCKAKHVVQRLLFWTVL